MTLTRHLVRGRQKGFQCTAVAVAAFSRFAGLLTLEAAGAWKVGLVILRHVESQSLYVIFRGTADIKDVISDVNIVPVTPYPDRRMGGLRVFGGAWNHLCARALEDIVPAIRDAVERGTDKIVFTGHSLGGGCAKLGLFYMQTAAHGVDIPAGVRLRAITFGAPMVFYPKAGGEGEGEGEAGGECSELLARLQPHILTFVNQKDIVPRLLGPKQNGSWARFFKKTNIMATAMGGLATGAVAVAAVATGGVATAGLVAAAGAMVAVKGSQYQHGGGMSGGMVGVQKMAAVQTATALLAIPPELEAEGQNYVAVGTYVFLSSDGTFTSALGSEAHGGLDIVCRPPAKAGGEVEYSSDDLAHGLRDHAIADYQHQVEQGVPKTGADGAAFRAAIQS